MANEPKQPDAHAPMKDGEAPHTDPGVPPDAQSEEPTGLPSSDRHHSEVTPAKP